eukprot:g4638.t1
MLPSGAGGKGVNVGNDQQQRQNPNNNHSQAIRRSNEARALTQLAASLPNLVKNAHLEKADLDCLAACKRNTVTGAVISGTLGGFLGFGVQNALKLNPRYRFPIVAIGSVFGFYPVVARSSTACIGAIMNLDTQFGYDARTIFAEVAPDSPYLAAVEAKILQERKKYGMDGGEDYRYHNGENGGSFSDSFSSSSSSQSSLSHRYHQDSDEARDISKSKQTERSLRTREEIKSSMQYDENLEKNFEREQEQRYHEDTRRNDSHWSDGKNDSYWSDEKNDSYWDDGKNDSWNEKDWHRNSEERGWWEDDNHRDGDNLDHNYDDRREVANNGKSKKPRRRTWDEIRAERSSGGGRNY